MEAKRNHLDDVLGDKLKNFSKEPPEMIWDGIRKNLDAGRKKKTIVWIRRMAAAVALLTAIGTGYYYISRHGAERLNTPIAVREKDSTITPEVPVSVQPGTAIREPSAGQVRNSDTINTALPVSKEQAYKEAAPALKNTPPGPRMADGSLPETNQETYGLRPEETATIHLQAVISPEDFRNVFPTENPSYADDTIIPRQQKAVKSPDLLTLYIEPSPVEPEKKDRLSLSAAFSPVYSYRSLGGEKSQVSQFYNQSENAKISYSGGVNIGYQASDRLSIRTGLVYARLGFEVGAVSILQASPESYNQPAVNNTVLLVENSTGEVNSSSGNSVLLSDNSDPYRYWIAYSSSLDSNPIKSQPPVQSPDVSINQWFHFVEVPVMFQYTIIDRTYALNLLGGMSTNFLLADDVILKDHGESSYLGTTGNVRRVNYSSNIGIGINIHLSDKLFFTFEPQFKYYLNSFNNHNLIISKPYYLGLYTGVRLAL